MKKLLTFAAIFAAFMMGFSACTPEDQPSDNPGTEQTPGDETPGDETPDQTPGDSDEYESPIVIDGKFDDWAAMDPAKVAVAECHPEAVLGGLKVLKVYADEFFVNVYIKMDMDFIEPESTPFHVYLDADNSAETGGYGDEFAEAVSEWSFEGHIMDGGVFCSYDPGLYPWSGEVGADGWEWIDNIMEGGLATGDGANDEYEFAISREMLGETVTFAEVFGIGVDIQDSGWESVGILPNDAVTESNTGGKAPLLRVTVY